MKRAILIHKTPATWNVAGAGEILVESTQNLNPNQDLIPSQVTDMMATDVYIQLVMTICEKLGIEDLHVVQGYSPDEERNWLSGESDITYKISSGVTYSCILGKEKLAKLGKFDMVFTRGKYHKLHNWIAEMYGEKPIWLHYNATSLTFPHLGTYIGKLLDNFSIDSDKSFVLDSKIKGMIIEHEVKIRPMQISELGAHFQKKRLLKQPTPYDVILIDDIKSYDDYQEVYFNKIIKKFTKPCLEYLSEVNYERQYDIFFCGTTLQGTKNHLQFVKLLKHIDSLTDINILVGIAGDRGNIPAFSMGLSSEFENITVENLGEVPREELFDLFNNSRTLVVLSGRDCNPRIIQEAGMCGAYVIAADTLSDGFEIFSKHPLLGTIIPTKKVSWFYQKNGNLIFDVDKAFAQKVLDKVNLARFPYMVHKVAKSTYSVENEAQNLTTLIRLLS